MPLLTLSGAGAHLTELLLAAKLGMALGDSGSCVSPDSVSQTPQQASLLLPWMDSYYERHQARPNVTQAALYPLGKAILVGSTEDPETE